MIKSMIRYQKFTNISEKNISVFVEAGSVDLSSNISSSFGTTMVIITKITPNTTTIIIAGYISADLSFHDTEATFST
jgi:5-enolpyruvylshikimate-3-phosphate synthase